MKDAKGHGSDPRGGPAHSTGVNALGRTGLNYPTYYHGSPIGEPGKRTAIKTGTSKAGEKIALVAGTTAVANADRTISYRPSFGVYVKKANYDGQVKGGLRYTWRFIKQDLTRDEAEKVFARRTGTGH
jgi:hypothetical protein